MFNKLKEFGKSFVWLLGAVILLAQTYRISAFYFFNLEFEIDILRDGAFALLGFAMMFIQNGLKSAALKVIKRKSGTV
jgi:hypothetical protein